MIIILVSHKNGQLIFQENIIKYIGEERIQKFINFCMGYMVLFLNKSIIRKLPERHDYKQ
jgi:hypothetical protein